MKTRLYLSAIKCAAALVATAGLTACSSSDDVTDAPVNPTYDGKSVKTQFAINIATPGSKIQTRMTSDNTQMSGSKFLGMQNIYLFPLTLEGSNGPTSSTTVSSIIPLGSIAANNGTSDAMHIDGTKDYKLYNDVNVAVGTNNFLFYGEGPNGQNMAPGMLMDNSFSHGALISSVNGKSSVGDINFKSVQIAASSDYSSIQNAFAEYLKGITNASYTNTTSSTTTSWNNMGDNLTGDMAVLKEAYINFIKLKAGSAAAILASVQSLYNIMKPIADKTASSDDAPNLAKTICEAILNSSGTIKLTASTSDPNYILNYDSNLDNTYKKFPEEQGLPQGSMVLVYTAGNSNPWNYNNSTSIIGSSSDNNVKVNDIVYPACLEYFVNTPLKASDSEYTSWQTTASGWDGETWQDWNTAVKPSTRTIALQNTILYGVASLKTTIKAESNILDDNQAALVTGTSNQQINIGNGFDVTGILIGGQPSQVEWNFLPASTESFAKTVFDRDITNIKATTADGSPFYTLLLDNMVTATGTGNDQKDVNFAIELKNTSNTDFYGVDGIVAAGQKFYLVGKMTVGDSQTITFPQDADYRFPGKDTNRIFIQDYTTNLNVTFKSLKNAYVTIPDLRASNLQLGLSVDLTWRSGLTFDVPIE